MVKPKEATNVLENLLRRAIAAGLATTDEAAQALTRLEIAKLPDETAPRLYQSVKEEAQREAEHACSPHSPQDEQELLEWLTNALRHAPFIKEAKLAVTGPYANLPALLRVVDQDGLTIRLGVSYCQDEETVEDFDDSFQP